jgi:hypothetical protein
MDKVKKWFDMVKQDKNRYIEEMEEKGLEIPKPKEKKESTKPKTAYNYFCLEVRPEIKESLKDEYNGKELTKAVGEKLKETWKSTRTANQVELRRTRMVSSSTLKKQIDG